MSKHYWILFGLLLTGEALAQEPAPFARGFYAGAGLGNAELILEDSDSANDFKGDDTGLRLLAGYRFFPHFAVEATYEDYGDAKDTVLGVDLQGSFKAFGVSAVGLLPFRSFDLFGKLGVGAWDGTVRAPAVGVSYSADNVDPIVGFGLQFHRGQLTFRGEVEGQLLGFDDDGDDEADDDDSVDFVSFTVLWSF